VDLRQLAEGFVHEICDIVYHEVNEADELGDIPGG
jgi:hypothetical protein